MWQLHAVSIECIYLFPLEIVQFVCLVHAKLYINVASHYCSDIRTYIGIAAKANSCVLAD